MNWPQKALLYFHTACHLGLRQILWRVVYRLRPGPRPNLNPAPPCSLLPLRVKPAPARRSVYDGRIKIFHQSVPPGKIGSPWEVPERSALWNNHLHYHEDTNPAWIARWIQENPPGKGLGWKPYPTSRRICNWIKFGALDAAALHSLAVQVRYLEKQIEYHRRGNHLLTNACALYMAGAFFTGPEAQRWQHLALKILHAEIPEQFYASGRHFEESPMVHALMVGDMLDMHNLAPHPILESTLARALGHLKHVTHPDGGLVLFSDSVLNVAPSTAELLEYGARLGISPIHHGSAHPQRMEQDGWCVFLDDGPVGAPYQCGHAHADNLTIEASHNGKRVIVDTGTSEYGLTPRRALERSTLAHNTLVLDGHNSSQVWSVFRMGKRAQSLPGGGHDGYRPFLHYRKIRIHNGALIIQDWLEGKGEHHIELPLHFAPDVNLDAWKIMGLGARRQEAFEYAPAFGLRLPSQKLVFRLRVKLPWYGEIRIMPA